MHGKGLMKIFNGTVWAYGLLGLMTFGYIVLVELAAASSAAISTPQFWIPPGPTRLFANQNYTWVWQILSVVSLISSLAWGFWRSKRTDLPEPHHLPMLCHLIWIVTLAFYHLLGFLLPFYKMGGTI